MGGFMQVLQSLSQMLPMSLQVAEAREHAFDGASEPTCGDAKMCRIAVRPPRELPPFGRRHTAPLFLRLIEAVGGEEGRL